MGALIRRSPDEITRSEIDNTLTDNLKLFSNISAISMFQFLSDHRPVKFKIKVPRKSTVNRVNNNKPLINKFRQKWISTPQRTEATALLAVDIIKIDWKDWICSAKWMKSQNGLSLRMTQWWKRLARMRYQAFQSCFESWKSQMENCVLSKSNILKDHIPNFSV